MNLWGCTENPLQTVVYDFKMPKRDLYLNTLLDHALSENVYIVSAKYD